MTPLLFLILWFVFGFLTGIVGICLELRKYGTITVGEITVILFITTLFGVLAAVVIAIEKIAQRSFWDKRIYTKRYKEEEDNE